MNRKDTWNPHAPARHTPEDTCLAGVDADQIRLEAKYGSSDF